MIMMSCVDDVCFLFLIFFLTCLESSRAGAVFCDFFMIFLHILKIIFKGFAPSKKYIILFMPSEINHFTGNWNENPSSVDMYYTWIWHLSKLQYEH